MPRWSPRGPSRGRRGLSRTCLVAIKNEDAAGRGGWRFHSSEMIPGYDPRPDEEASGQTRRPGGVFA